MKNMNFRGKVTTKTTKMGKMTMKTMKNCSKLAGNPGPKTWAKIIFVSEISDKKPKLKKISTKLNILNFDLFQPMLCRLCIQDSCYSHDRS